MATTSSAYRDRAGHSSRVVFDLRDRLSESRRALESKLRFMLKEISASAGRALNHAKEVRDRGEAAIAIELQQLEQHRAALRDLASP